MTKTKRQLRAEAVERLKNCVAARFDAESIVITLTSGRHGQNDWSFECDKLIDLLTEDDSTIPEADSTTESSSDELPEVDAVAILRKAARSTSVNTSIGDVLRYNVPGNEPSTWQTEEDACEALADMVERDYVRREDYDAEIKAFDRLQDVKQELITERDEWKAKAEKLAERMDKREETMRRLAKLVDVTPEAEYSYNGDPQSVVDGGDFGELATLVFGAVRRLMSECDEWRAKAEQAERSMNAAAGKWAKADAELREGSSKVRAGSSNLDYLMERDRDFVADMVSTACYCRYCAFDDECDGFVGENNPKCTRGNREWLLSPHVDGHPVSSSSPNGTANGTCPDAMGQPSNHSKAQSKDAPTLSDLYGILSDDCGHPADMSGKRADCVRNDGFASENDASAEDMGANDAKAELDSREKLEADIAGMIGAGPLYEIALKWLDRQAAITERELQAQVDDYRAEWHRACAERAELRRDLTAKKNKGIELAEQLGKAMAERDEYREKVGAMLDAAQEIRRLAEIE